MFIARSISHTRAKQGPKNGMAHHPSLFCLLLQFVETAIRGDQPVERPLHALRCRRIAQEAREVMAGTPGIADVRVGREEGRPEIAIRVDRPKAAMLGMTVQGVANTIQTNVQGTQAAQYRERGYEYPIVVRLRPGILDPQGTTIRRALEGLARFLERDRAAGAHPLPELRRGGGQPTVASQRAE